MKNNVYIRSDRSIFTISITRICLLIPLIIYGFYKNGIHLYNNDYINLTNMFKPLIIIFGSALIGALINIIYEKLIKKSKDNLKDILFSSFHIEYGMVIGCLMPINVNLIIYFSILTVILFISKFLNNRVNIMCLTILLIYTVSYFIGNDFIFANSYELDKKFSLDFMDYVIGKGVGGIASTHVLLLLLAFAGMHLTNNNKSSITMSSLITIVILEIIYALVGNVSFVELLFANNILFILTFVLTDSVTSCYTVNGKIAYGVISALLMFGLSFINPIIAPFIAILITSLFNIFIDKQVNKIFKNNLH